MREKSQWWHFKWRNKENLAWLIPGFNPLKFLSLQNIATLELGFQNMNHVDKDIINVSKGELKNRKVVIYINLGLNYFIYI